MLTHNDVDVDIEKRRKKLKPSATQLMDLDVDRVDGVDKPATGRGFLLFKSEDAPHQIDDATDEGAARRVEAVIKRVDAEREAEVVEKGAPGGKFGVSMGSILDNRVDAFDITETGRDEKDDPDNDEIDAAADADGDLEPVDEGVDAFGREYSDEVLARLGHLNDDPTEMSPIPNAGAGETREFDARGIRYAQENFKPDTGKGPSTNPMKPSGGDAYSVKDLANLPEVMTRLGDGYFLAPADPGIAPAGSANFPGARTSPVLKEKKVSFRNIVLGGRSCNGSDFLG